MSRPIYKHTNTGNFICKYQSTTQAARDCGVDESSIRKAAGRNKIIKGFLWSRYRLDGGGTAGKAEEKYTALHTQANVLVLDIEIAPCLAFVWPDNVWKTRISPANILSDWYMLSWSAKWLGDTNVMSAGLISEEALNQDDSRILILLHHLLSQADIVIAHNGDAFDLPKIRARFISNGLPPTTYYKQIDTLRVAQKEFSFTYNKLNELAKIFGIPEKIETTYELWKKCYFGDAEALRQMEVYNRHDVEILEEVYLHLRPWMKSHTNVSLYSDDEKPMCACCGSDKINKLTKYYYTNTGRYETFRCLDCGAILRSRKTTISKNKNILVSVPNR